MENANIGKSHGRRFPDSDDKGFCLAHGAHHVTAAIVPRCFRVQVNALSRQSGALVGRKIEFEGGAFIALAVGNHISFVIGDHTLANGQSDALTHIFRILGVQPLK